MDRNRTVMLAAGGTGGHLFPAFALAEELGRRGYTVDLVTDMRGDRYGTGFPARAVHQVPSATLASKSPVAVAKTGLALAKGIVAARKLMKNVRPLVVVGFGGYPTFPPLLAARQLGIPTMLHEQNAVLGRANKMLARRVNAIATSFETTKFLEGPLLPKPGSPAIRSAVSSSKRLRWVIRRWSRTAPSMFWSSAAVRAPATFPTPSRRHSHVCLPP